VLAQGRGLVRDVFEQQHMLALQGNEGIGHVRYPTAGCDSASEAQPFYVNAPYGICLAHNGNLTNAAELAEVLIREDRRHLNSESDSEVLLNVFASELQRVGTPRVTPADIFAAASAVYRRCRGGYAAVVLVIGHGVLGFRDPNGIRPLVLGQRRTPRGTEYMLASESVALDMLSFELVRDVAPGEAVFIDEQGRLHSQQCVATVRHTPCIFEYVYFARPDSIIDNISVYRARMRMGEKLAARILQQHPDHDIDVVIPIPDTSRTSALQMAQIWASSTAKASTRTATSAAPSSCRGRSSANARCGASSTPSTWSFAARTCCWWMIRSCAAPPRRRSSTWRAKRAPRRSTSPRPRRRCAFRMSTASTCRPPASWWPRPQRR
jgi:amidophosphoribosyltransferase